MPITKDPPEKGLAGAQKKKTGFTKGPPVPGLAGAIPKPKVPLIAQGEIEGFGRWTLDENGLLDITGSGKMPDWKGFHKQDTPYSDYEFKVTTPWGKVREDIKSSRISPGITSIGKAAYYGCTNLTSIIIPNGVTSIGDYAFVWCWKLTSIIMPNGITSIGTGAFRNCSSLTSITIPDGVVRIGSVAFSCCYRLTNINIPSSVTNIEGGAFWLCYWLESVIIPNSVTSIGRSVFWECGLKHVKMPSKFDRLFFKLYYGIPRSIVEFT